jgi:heme exporter protein D
MADTSPLSLRELVDPAPLLPREGWPAWWWAALAAAVLLVAALVLHQIRRRRAAPPDPRRLREEARRAALAELDGSGRGQSPAELATGVSLALRRYLAAALNDPALFETHEEFLARGEAPAALAAPVREQLAGVFAMLARMKYAHDAPPPADDLVARSRSLVDLIHAALPA